MISPDTHFTRYLDGLPEPVELDSEQEAAQLRAALAGDVDARRLLVAANLRTAVAEAEAAQERGLELPDLLLEANQMLYRAVEQFQPHSELRFEDFARRLVRQAIEDALALAPRKVPVPDDEDLAERWRRVGGELDEFLGRAEPVLPDHSPDRVFGEDLKLWKGLVWSIVNRIRMRLPASVSREELYSAGMVGLMSATRSYDRKHGTKFKNYAYHRIRGAILDELRRLDFLPRSQRDKAKRMGKDAPSILGIPTDESGNENLAAVPESSEVEQADLIETVKRRIDELPDKMRTVMSLYYGEGLKMRQIGDRMGLTESRVRQIRQHAIAKLRRPLLAAEAG